MREERKREDGDLKEDRPTSDSCLFVGKGHGGFHCAADVPGQDRISLHDSRDRFNFNVEQWCAARVIPW